MEGFRLHSATSISEKRINVANFLRHLTRFNSKEGFTPTLVTTQELSRSLLLCNKSTRDKTFSTCAVLLTFQGYNCLHNLLFSHDKNTAKTKIYVLTFLLFSKEHFCEKKIKKTDLIMLTNMKWAGLQCILGTTEIAPIKSK